MQTCDKLCIKKTEKNEIINDTARKYRNNNEFAYF